MNPVRPWYYTYVLYSKSAGQFYTGATANLKQRLLEHKQGLVATTKHKRPLQLIYFEACLNKNDAFRRERYLRAAWVKDILNNGLKSYYREV